MLPNSLRLVSEELRETLARGGDAYWLVNCSNVKPHAYILAYIAALWRTGDAEPEQFSLQYAETYYGAEQAISVSEDLRRYAEAAVSYGPHADNHAGDQFYHHVPRMLVTQFLRNRGLPAAELCWLSDRKTLAEQTAELCELYKKAVKHYDAYQDRCLETFLSLKGAHRQLYKDSVLLQARLYRLWSDGALYLVSALLEGFRGDWKRCFYLAGQGKRAFLRSYREMEDCEHGRWIGFYQNECQTDVRQTASVAGALMSYARALGEGPHYYAWMREFMDSEEDRRDMLILNTERHPEDEELLRYMRNRWES